MCDLDRLRTVEESYAVLGYRTRQALYEHLERGHISRGVYRIGRAYRLNLPEVLEGLRVGGAS